MEDYMKKITFIMVPIFFLVISQMCFSDIFISYKSGTCMVDIKGNGTWQDAVIDMELNSSSIIKTGPDGELEIEIESDTILIGKNSLVNINGMIGKIGEKKKIGWLKSVSKYAKSIGKGEEGHTRTALTGVRGKKSEGNEFEWFDDFEESEDPEGEFQVGKAYFEEGKYTKAIPIFTEIIDKEETGPFKYEIAFYLGVSLFNNLRYREALLYLGESLADKSAYYYGPTLLHYSITHYFLKNYEKAIEGFKLYTEYFAGGELTPYAVFMLGKCYKDIGRPEDARQYFMEIERRYKNTELYQDALDEIESL